MDISVIIPVYNEEKNIQNLYHRLSKVLHGLGVSYELIFVNDGSKDASIGLIKVLSKKYESVKYIDFSRNFGHQIAVTAGLDKTSGDAVVIIDADLQDPPELIIEMYQKRLEGFEVIYAKRKNRRGENFLKLLTASVFYRLLAKMTSISIPVDTGDFRMIDNKIVEVLREMPEKNKYLRGQISWIGFNQTFVEYERQERQAGATGYTYRKMLHFALDGITAFSDVPLKIVTYFGFIVSVIAFFVAIYALLAKFVWENSVPGWTSLMIAILFIGGIQMIAIGIIGEYLSRMNHNIRNRPLYIIRESNIKEK
ncbi:glycosyltransferase family 2 protein [bacterium]|jgi:glycosyltransferase involved in cell wall biosynthesis|nr:glycosyltransferase family 2 protein [Saprospiraceae bacterium]MDC3253266.1 glycosyltransferase family 2 protein [bacterium]MDG1432369.1 glycosyltransferase family 2 protein [Saprospiraceae bacterium]